MLPRSLCLNFFLFYIYNFISLSASLPIFLYSPFNSPTYIWYNMNVFITVSVLRFWIALLFSYRQTLTQFVATTFQKLSVTSIVSQNNAQMCERNSPLCGPLDIFLPLPHHTNSKCEFQPCYSIFLIYCMARYIDLLSRPLFISQQPTVNIWPTS